MISFSDGHEPVVAHSLLPIDLFSFDNAYETRTYSAAGKCWLIHKKEHIDWISVLSHRLREKAKIIWKHHPSGKYLFERKDPLVWIESKLIAATLRSFDNDLEDAILPVDRLKLGRVH